MNINRQTLIDNLHRHIRNYRAVKDRTMQSSFLNSFHNIISVVPVYERLTWAELDDFLLKNTEKFSSVVSYWEYGMLLKFWFLFGAPPFVYVHTYMDRILDMFFRFNDHGREHGSVHCIPGRILAKTPLAAAMEDEDVGRIKMLADLRPNPEYARRSTFAYALNHGKTDLFARLFQEYGTPEDLEAMKGAFIDYWIEILRTRKVCEYFGHNPRENWCWQFFWKIALNEPGALRKIRNEIETFPLISEPFVYDAIRYGVVKDVALIEDEPNLSWLTYRRRAQLLVEFADDFFDVLDAENPILESIDMALDLMEEKK